MNIEIKRHELGLRRPLETSKGRIERRDCYLIRIEEDGVSGIGEASPLPGWTERLNETWEELERISRWVEDGRAREAVETTKKVENIEFPAARHGLSLGFADLEAKKEGVPLYEYLGDGSESRKDGSVDVNLTIGVNTVDETRSLVGEAIDDGFECIKMKVGSKDVDEDIERVKSVCGSFDGVELRLDANGSWSYEEASEVFTKLDGKVEYVEQPLEASEFDELQRLRDEKDSDIGVAVDESMAVSPSRSLGVSDVAVLKPMVLGGVDRAHRMGELAKKMGVDPVVTTTVDSAVARTGAVHLSASLGCERACGLATGDMLEDDFYDPAPVSDGGIKVPETEGIGTDGPWDSRREEEGL